MNRMSDSFGKQGTSEPAGTVNAASTNPGGIHTDRLTSRQLQVWRSIEQLIQAADASGKPRYPRLLGLWRWAQSSNSPIYIELLEEKNPKTYNAGFLTVQEPAAGESRAVAVIQLWPRIIENATAEEADRRSDGFLPFEGLGKMERYAEVVGHELAHAALHLQDARYARVCRELDSEKAAFLASKRQNRQGNAYDQKTLERLARLKSLTEQVEQPAQTTEVEIWRELLAGQKVKAGSR